MISILEHVENNSQETQRLIGLKYDHLQQVFVEAGALHKQKKVKIETGKKRIITKGGGRKLKLSVIDKIISTLIYLR